jgi:site-specific recombinase XerD
MHIKNLHEQFCEYQIAFKGYSEATIDGYQHALRIFLIFHDDIERIDEVTEMRAQQFFYWGRTERHWKPVTFVTYHKNLMPFFDYAVKNGYIDSNPFANIEKPRLGKSLPKALTKQQARVILDAALHKSAVTDFTRYRNHAIYALFLYAGLRKKEVLKLSMHDVDLTNNRLSIREAKGNKDRMLPVSQKLHKILNRYISARNRRGSECEQFFVSSNDDTAFTEYGLVHLQRIMQGVVDFDFHIHKLRHTFATLMLDGGCNIYALSKMMGHSDIKTTTIYLSTSTEQMQNEMHKHPLNGL